MVCFTQPLQLSNEEKVAAILRSGIFCRLTMQHWPAGQVARARALRPLWEIDTGHDLMVTEPKAVAERLLQAAQQSLQVEEAVRKVQPSSGS